MRREQLFSSQGFYGFLVSCNALMHREAVERGGEILEHFLARGVCSEPIRVLDLACGGAPVIIAEIMRRASGFGFAYTGIDINPDQVAAARGGFDFPANVLSCEVVEGNAWDPAGLLGAHSPFDLVFSGMNLHHGTPEELQYLASQVYRLLADDGVFVRNAG